MTDFPGDFPPTSTPPASYTPPTVPPPKAKRKTWSPLAILLALSAAFFALFLFVSGGLYLLQHGGKGASSESAAGAPFFKKGAVAVVEMNGPIMDSRATLRRLQTAFDSSEVKAVVVRLNSPGGAVAPSQEIYEAVKRAKKPVVASMGSVAASGAFYIAMGAQKVYANPGTITGSIGVIMEFANLAKLYEWAKIKRYVIKTGKFKDAGAEFRDMTEEERALMQGMVDDVLVQFKQAVAEGRKLPMEKVNLIADGRILSGSQAKRLALVDQLGTLQDAIDDAAKLGGIEGKPKVIYPEKRQRWWLEMLEDGREDSESESRAFVDSARGVVRGLRLLGQLAGGLETPAPASSVAPGIYWLWRGGVPE